MRLLINNIVLKIQNHVKIRVGQSGSEWVRVGQSTVLVQPI